MSLTLNIPRVNLQRMDLAQLTLWSVFMFMPFIDAATGFLINRGMLAIGGVGSPSQLFRFLLTALLLIQIHRPRHLYLTLLTMIWLIIVELINLPLHNRPDWLLVGGVYSYKLAFGLIVYFVFREYFTTSRLTFSTLQNYIINSCVIYTLIVIISDMLGISASAYPGADFGSKGVFADGNGMGVFLGVCFLVVLDRYLAKKKIKDLIIFLLTAKVLFGLGSKAGMLFIAAGLFLLFIKQKFYIKLIIGAITLSLVILFIEPLTEITRAAFQLITWRIERSGSIWDIILGGREIYIAEAQSYSYDNFIQVFKLIVGGGYKLSFRDPWAPGYDADGIFIIEADLFDVFFMYGVLGFIGYIAIFVKGLRTSSGSYKGRKTHLLKWAWVLLFIHSALAGHVLSSGIALLILPSLLLLMEYRNKSA